MFRSLLLAVVTAACLASTARADLVLLDNTSNLTAWNTSTANNYSGNFQAYSKLSGMTFVTGPSNYDLGSIAVVMAYTNGSLSPTMRLSLFENGSTSAVAPAGGATATYSQDFSGFTFNGTQQVYTFTPSTTWHLKANTDYSFWLGTSEVTNATYLRWNLASASASSAVGFTQKGGFYTTNGGASYNTPGNTLSMQITGTAVPEIDPAGMGSVLALVTGMLGLLERRRTIAA